MFTRGGLTMGLYLNQKKFINPCILGQTDGSINLGSTNALHTELGAPILTVQFTAKKTPNDLLHKRTELRIEQHYWPTAREVDAWE
jgi:hypothetical protein